MDSAHTLEVHEYISRRGYVHFQYHLWNVVFGSNCEEEFHVRSFQSAALDSLFIWRPLGGEENRWNCFTFQFIWQWWILCIIRDGFEWEIHWKLITNSVRCNINGHCTDGVCRNINWSCLGIFNYLYFHLISVSSREEDITNVGKRSLFSDEHFC